MVLINIAAMFQRALDLILTNFKWHTYLIYRDDVIICSKLVEEDIKYVGDILTYLMAALV